MKTIISLGAALILCACANEEEIQPVVASPIYRTTGSNVQYSTPESIEKTRMLLGTPPPPETHRSCQEVELSIRGQRQVSNEEHDRCKDECMSYRGNNAKRIVNIRDIITACQKNTYVMPSGDASHTHIEEDSTGKLNIVPYDPHIVRITATNGDCLKNSATQVYSEEEIQEVKKHWMRRFPDDSNIIYCMEIYDGNMR